MSRQNAIEVNPDVQAYVDSVKQRAEEMVKLRFPRKILELNDLIESPQFNLRDPACIQQPLNIPVPDAQAISRALNNHHQHNNYDSLLDSEETVSPTTRGKKRKAVTEDESPNKVYVKTAGTQVLALPTGPVLSNENILQLIDQVKPQLRQLVEDTNLLKMWVTFLIPKIEDGNNFGVSIQEDTLGEIRTVEAEAAAFYEQISRYFISRGKIVSKVAKYPHIDDYRNLVGELDEKEFLSLKIVVCEVRNHYASLYDLIIKNFEKIIRPRSSNAENLY